MLEHLWGVMVVMVVLLVLLEQRGVLGFKRKPDGRLDGTEFLHLNQQEMELWAIIHAAPSFKSQLTCL